MNRDKLIRDHLIRKHLEPLLVKLKRDADLPLDTERTVENFLEDDSEEMQALLIAGILRLFQLQKKYERLIAQAPKNRWKGFIDRIRKMMKPKETYFSPKDAEHFHVSFKVDDTCDEVNRIYKNISICQK